MPLIIDTKTCEGHDPKLMYPVATYMMVLGVQALKTDEDVKELYIRYLQYCITHDELEGRMTFEEISKYKGAWANVSKITPTQHAKRVAEWAREQADAILQNEMK